MNKPISKQAIIEAYGAARMRPPSVKKCSRSIVEVRLFGARWWTDGHVLIKGRTPELVKIPTLGNSVSGLGSPISNKYCASAASFISSLGSPKNMKLFRPKEFVAEPHYNSLSSRLLRAKSDDLDMDCFQVLRIYEASGDDTKIMLRGDSDSIPICVCGVVDGEIVAAAMSMHRGKGASRAA
jgi:hypothetical protein